MAQGRSGVIATNVYLVGVQPTRNVIGNIMTAMAIHRHTQSFPLPLGAEEKQVISTFRFADNGNEKCKIVCSLETLRKSVQFLDAMQRYHFSPPPAVDFR